MGNGLNSPASLGNVLHELDSMSTQSGNSTKYNCSICPAPSTTTTIPYTTKAEFNSKYVTFVSKSSTRTPSAQNKTTTKTSSKKAIPSNVTSHPARAHSSDPVHQEESRPPTKGQVAVVTAEHTKHQRARPSDHPTADANPTKDPITPKQDAHSEAKTKPDERLPKATPAEAHTDGYKKTNGNDQKHVTEAAKHGHSSEGARSNDHNTTKRDDDNHPSANHGSTKHEDRTEELRDLKTSDDARKTKKDDHSIIGHTTKRSKPSEESKKSSDDHPTVKPAHEPTKRTDTSKEHKNDGYLTTKDSPKQTKKSDNSGAPEHSNHSEIKSPTGSLKQTDNPEGSKNDHPATKNLVKPTKQSHSSDDSRHDDHIVSRDPSDSVKQTAGSRKSNTDHLATEGPLEHTKRSNTSERSQHDDHSAKDSVKSHLSEEPKNDNRSTAKHSIEQTKKSDSSEKSKEDDHSPTKDPTGSIKRADSSRGPKNDQSATQAPIKQTKRSDISERPKRDNLYVTKGPENSIKQTGGSHVSKNGDHSDDSAAMNSAEPAKPRDSSEKSGDGKHPTTKDPVRHTKQSDSSERSEHGGNSATKDPSKSFKGADSSRGPQKDRSVTEAPAENTKKDDSSGNSKDADHVATRHPTDSNKQKESSHEPKNDDNPTVKDSVRPTKQSDSSGSGRSKGNSATQDPAESLKGTGHSGEPKGDEHSATEGFTEHGKQKDSSEGTKHGENSVTKDLSRPPEQTHASKGDKNDNSVTKEPVEHTKESNSSGGGKHSNNTATKGPSDSKGQTNRSEGPKNDDRSVTKGSIEHTKDGDSSGKTKHGEGSATRDSSDSIKQTHRSEGPNQVTKDSVGHTRPGNSSGRHFGSHSATEDPVGHTKQSDSSERSKHGDYSATRKPTDSPKQTDHSQGPKVGNQSATTGSAEHSKKSNNSERSTNGDRSATRVPTDSGQQTDHSRESKADHTTLKHSAEPTEQNDGSGSSKHVGLSGARSTGPIKRVYNSRWPRENDHSATVGSAEHTKQGDSSGVSKDGNHSVTKSPTELSKQTGGSEGYRNGHSVTNSPVEHTKQSDSSGISEHSGHSVARASTGAVKQTQSSGGLGKDDHSPTRRSNEHTKESDSSGKSKHDGYSTADSIRQTGLSKGAENGNHSATRNPLENTKSGNSSGGTVGVKPSTKRDTAESDKYVNDSRRTTVADHSPAEHGTKATAHSGGTEGMHNNHSTAGYHQAKSTSRMDTFNKCMFTNSTIKSTTVAREQSESSGRRSSRDRLRTTTSASSKNEESSVRPGDRLTTATGKAKLSDSFEEPTSGEHSGKSTTEATKHPDHSEGPLSNEVTSAKSLQEDTKRTDGPGTVLNSHSTAKNSTEATKPSDGASREIDGSRDPDNHSMTTKETKSSVGSKVPASEDHLPTKGATQVTRPIGRSEGPSTSDRSKTNKTRKDSSLTGSRETTIEKDSRAESATEAVQPSEGTGTPRKSDDSGMRTIEETKLAGDHSNAKSPTKATTRMDHSGGSPVSNWSPAKNTRENNKYTSGLWILIGGTSPGRRATKFPEHKTESYDYNYDYNYTYPDISSARRTTESAEHSEGSEKPSGSRESPTKNTTESTYHMNTTFKPESGNSSLTKGAVEAIGSTVPYERFARSINHTNSSIKPRNSHSEYATEVTIRTYDSEDSRSGTHPTARQPTEVTEDRGGYKKSGIGHFTISSGTEAHRYAASEAHTDGLRRNTTDKDEVRINGRGGDAKHSTTSFSAVADKQRMASEESPHRNRSETESGTRLGEREDGSRTTGRARAEKAIFVSTTPKAPFMGGAVTDPIRKESNTSRHNYADLSTLAVTSSVNGSEGDLDRSTRGYSAAAQRHFINRNGKQDSKQQKTTAAHLTMSDEGSHGRSSADRFTTKSKPDDIAVQRDSGGSDGEDHLSGKTYMATQLPASSKKLSDQSDNHDLAGNESRNHPPNTTEHPHGLQSSPSKEEALHRGAIWAHKTSISADLPHSTAETIHGGGEIRHVPRKTHDSTVKIKVTTDSRSSSARDVTPTILAPTMKVKPAFRHDSSSANNTTSVVLVDPTLSTTMAVTTARLLKVVNETVTYLKNGSVVLMQQLFYSNGTSVYRNITEFVMFRGNRCVDTSLSNGLTRSCRQNDIKSQGTSKVEGQIPVTSKASPESVPRPSPTEHIEKQPPSETTPVVPNPPGVIFGPKNDSGQSVTRCPQIEVDLSNSISPLPNSTELSGPQLPGTLVIHMCSISYAFPTLQQPLKIYECLNTGEWTDNNNGDKCEYVAPRRKNSADL